MELEFREFKRGCAELLTEFNWVAVLLSSLLRATKVLKFPIIDYMPFASPTLV